MIVNIYIILIYHTFFGYALAGLNILPEELISKMYNVLYLIFDFGLPLDI